MKSTYKLNQWHCFEMKGSYFIFVAENLRLYAVDKETFQNLQTMQEKYGYAELFEVESDDSIVGELVEEEMAVCIKDSQNKDEDHELKPDETNEIKHTSEKGANKVIVSNIVLELANDCNLNCLYCYGDGGSYGRKREIMSFETAKKAIDLMVENSGELKELRITFFGGEPLINFDVLKQVVSYCKSIEPMVDKKFAYNMTTNGTIMNDEIYHFIKKNYIEVMISMDGNKDLQDCYRCYENGNGSYDDIVKNIEKFKEANGGHLSVRSTVCKPNLNLKKIKDDLMHIGFTKVNMSIVDTNKDSPLFVGKENEKDLLKNYANLADDYIDSIKGGAKFSNNVFDDVIRILYFKQLRIQSCNAGKNGFALGTDGNIYPCQRFMGMEDYTVGNVVDGIDSSITNEYRKANVLLKEDCNNCWARFLCGGACTHTCVSQENDIMKAPKCYCETYKGLYEIVLYIYFSLKNWNEDIFKSMFEKSENKQAI